MTRALARGLLWPLPFLGLGALVAHAAGASEISGAGLGSIAAAGTHAGLRILRGVRALRTELAMRDRDRHLTSGDGGR